MEHNKWDKSPNAKAKYKLKILEKEIYATRTQLSTYTTVFE
jgi:hypothetical protein